MDPLRHTPAAQTFRPLSRQSEQDSQEDPPPDDHFYESPSSGEDLTPEEEFAEGDRHQRELEEQYPEWPPGLPLLQQCYQRLRPLSARTDLRYRFAALDTPRPLASSCPNGMVFFSRGLLEHLTPDQVCYFGAHEIAHSELRHYATRQRRLSQLQQALPAQAGTPLRLRIDQAAVLAVRHQEEFEADHQAALWLNFELAHSALQQLAALCQRLAPETLTQPSHPTFPARLTRVRDAQPAPELVAYCYSLLST